MPKKISDNTPESQSEDIAYTINHAFACTATDFIDPFVGKWTQDYLGTKFSIGCGHDHGHEEAAHHHHDHTHCESHEHGHHHTPHAKLSHWWAGELAGDFGAVPVTVSLQRFAPSLMASTSLILNPLFGGFFKSGAKSAAREWAKKEGIASDSERAKAYADTLYQYEMHHLPQALVWTVSSVAINLATQRALGSHAPLSHMLAGKAAGASISATAVVGARGLFPDAARNWDRLTSSNVFLPATKTVSTMFGIEEKAVDGMMKTETSVKSGTWKDRVQEEDEKSPSRSQ